MAQDEAQEKRERRGEYRNEAHAHRTLAAKLLDAGGPSRRPCPRGGRVETVTVEIKDVGTTRIEVPDAAKKKLR